MRRAISAADSAFAAAKSTLGNEVEPGGGVDQRRAVVGTPGDCIGTEPEAVLSMIADCFAAKREFAKTMKRRCSLERPTAR